MAVTAEPVKFELEVYSDIEDGTYAAKVHWCVVTMTTEYAQLLLRRMNLVRDLRRDDADVYQIRLHDRHVGAKWFDENEDGDGPAGEPKDMDMETVVVTADDVTWKAYSHDADAPLFTNSVSRSEIEEIVTAGVKGPGEIPERS